jgi:hypothetical protein
LFGANKPQRTCRYETAQTRQGYELVAAGEWLQCVMAAAAADLPPALSGDSRQATVPGEPGGGRSRRWLTTPV